MSAAGILYYNLLVDGVRFPYLAEFGEIWQSLLHIAKVCRTLMSFES
jgi:hypothetical protein